MHPAHLAAHLPEVLAELSAAPGTRFLRAPGQREVWFDAALLEVWRRGQPCTPTPHEVELEAKPAASVSLEWTVTGMLPRTWRDGPHDVDLASERSTP